jgi:hypothetical protein
VAQLPFLLFDADNHRYEALAGFSDAEIRLVMRENALGLAQRRPASAA